MRDKLVFAAVAIAAAFGVLAQSQWKEVGVLGQRHMVLVDAADAGNADLLKQVAAKTCGSGKACVVAFWSDAGSVPSVMPMTAAEQNAMVAQYVRNPRSGAEELLLKCHPGNAPGVKCLR